MRGAAIGPIFLDSCHPRPVNSYGGSYQMIMREGDTAVIGLDLRATKRAEA
jgi:hypothetical protein